MVEPVSAQKSHKTKNGNKGEIVEPVAVWKCYAHW